MALKSSDASHHAGVCVGESTVSSMHAADPSQRELWRIETGESLRITVLGVQEGVPKKACTVRPAYQMPQACVERVRMVVCRSKVSKAPRACIACVGCKRPACCIAGPVHILTFACFVLPEFPPTRCPHTRNRQGHRPPPSWSALPSTRASITFPNPPPPSDKTPPTLQIAPA